MKNIKKINIGEVVRLKANHDIIGKVKFIKKNTLIIETENINIKVNIQSVELMKNYESLEKNNIYPQQKLIKNYNKDFNTEIDFHGYTLADALEELDRYIDKAILLGHKYLKIIHGKGTGILRSGIRNCLEKDSRVKDISINTPLFNGGAGVTYIEIF